MARTAEARRWEPRSPRGAGAITDLRGRERAVGPWTTALVSPLGGPLCGGDLTASAGEEPHLSGPSDDDTCGVNSLLSLRPCSSDDIKDGRAGSLPGAVPRAVTPGLPGPLLRRAGRAVTGHTARGQPGADSGPRFNREHGEPGHPQAGGCDASPAPHLPLPSRPRLTDTLAKAPRQGQGASVLPAGRCPHGAGRGDGARRTAGAGLRSESTQVPQRR